MSKKLSEFYGLEVYSIKEGEHIGRIEDIILNLNEGVVVSLCLKPLDSKMTQPDEVKKVILESINYEDVTGVGDIILVKSKPAKKSGVGGGKRK